MKLYHIDRSGNLKTNGKIELVKEFYTETTNNEYLKNGLLSHGKKYYLGDHSNKDYATDAKTYEKHNFNLVRG